MIPVMFSGPSTADSDVGSDVGERHTMYASVPRCRRWRAKYTARRGAARVRIPAQTQRTQTQGASTRSACVHRAIPHSASLASSATASWRLWSGRRPRACRARRGAARVLMPVQVQRTRTQRASTRSACAHRAIPHIASSIIASWQAAQGHRGDCGLRAGCERARRDGAGCERASMAALGIGTPGVGAGAEGGVVRG